MADIIIPNLADDVITAVDIKARSLGLSRNDSLRRVLARERTVRASAVSVDDLAGLGQLIADLADQEAMRRAWSCDQAGS